MEFPFDQVFSYDNSISELTLYTMLLVRKFEIFQSPILKSYNSCQNFSKNGKTNFLPCLILPWPHYVELFLNSFLPATSLASLFFVVLLGLCLPRKLLTAPAMAFLSYSDPFFPLLCLPTSLPAPAWPNIPLCFPYFLPSCTILPLSPRPIFFSSWVPVFLPHLDLASLTCLSFFLICFLILTILLFFCI